MKYQIAILFALLAGQLFSCPREARLRIAGITEPETVTDVLVAALRSPGILGSPRMAASALHAHEFLVAVLEGSNLENVWYEHSPFGVHYLTYGRPRVQYKPKDLERLRTALRDAKVRVRLTRAKPWGDTERAMDVVQEQLDGMISTHLTVEGAIFREALQHITDIEASIARLEASFDAADPKQVKKMGVLRNQELPQAKAYAKMLFGDLSAKFVELFDHPMPILNKASEKPLTAIYADMITYWIKENEIPAEAVTLTPANRKMSAVKIIPSAEHKVGKFAKEAQKVKWITADSEPVDFAIYFIPELVFDGARMTVLTGGIIPLQPHWLLLDGPDPLTSPLQKRSLKLLQVMQAGIATPFRGNYHVHKPTMNMPFSTYPLYTPVVASAILKSGAKYLPRLKEDLQILDFATRLYEVTEMPLRYENEHMKALGSVDLAAFQLLRGYREAHHKLEDWNVRVRVVASDRSSDYVAIDTQNSVSGIVVRKRMDGKASIEILHNDFTYEVLVETPEALQIYKTLEPLFTGTADAPLTAEQKEAVIKYCRSVQRTMDLTVMHTRTLVAEMRTINPLMREYVIRSTPENRDTLLGALQDYKEPEIDRITARSAPRRNTGLVVDQRDRMMEGPPPLPSAARRLREAEAKGTDREKTAARNRAVEVAGVEGFEGFVETYGFIPRDRQPDQNGTDYFIFHPLTGKEYRVEIKSVSSLDGMIVLSPNEINEAIERQQKGEWLLALVYVDKTTGQTRLHLSADLPLGKPLSGKSGRPFAIQDVLDLPQVDLTARAPFLARPTWRLGTELGDPPQE